MAVARFGMANSKAVVFKPLTTPAGVMLKVNVGMVAVTLRTTGGVAVVESLTATVMFETVTAMLVALAAAAQLAEIVALVIANWTLNEVGVTGMEVVKSAKVALTVALPCPTTCGRTDAPVAESGALKTAPLNPSGLSTLMGGISPQLANSALNPRAAPNNATFFIHPP